MSTCSISPDFLIPHSEFQKLSIPFYSGDAAYLRVYKDGFYGTWWELVHSLLVSCAKTTLTTQIFECT